MKKFLFIITLAVCCATFSFLSCHQKKQAPEQQIAQLLIKQVDSFSNNCQALLQEVDDKNYNEKKLQQLFLQTRTAYKKFEWASEYFEPATSRFVNGPPVQEIEVSGQIFQPAGLQVIEGFLFPHFDTTKKKANKPVEFVAIKMQYL